MEKLQKEPFTKKNCLLGILFILIYFLVSYVPSIFYDFNNNLYNFGLIITYLILLLSGILIFKNRLKRDFKHLKNNFKEYLAIIINNQLIMFTIYFIVSFISFFILKENSSSANQQAIESLPMLLILFSALIYAPIVEELVFHASIRRIIKNDFFMNELIKRNWVDFKDSTNTIQNYIDLVNFLKVTNLDALNMIQEKTLFKKSGENINKYYITTH